MRCAVLLLALVPAVSLAAGTRPEAGLINTIDRTFQSRFEKIDFNRLGMRRIPVTPEHDEFSSFSPQNAEDRRVTAALKGGGWEAAFYVAGRRGVRQAAALTDFRKKNPKDPKAQSGEIVDSWIHRRTVSKPVRLTKAVDGTTPLPSQIALIPRVPEAFQAFAEGKNAFDFEEDGWAVTARPIPASRVECLGCHKQDENGKALKVGDALGVAFYAFARAGQRKPLQQATGSSKPRPKPQTGSLR